MDPQIISGIIHGSLTRDQKTSAHLVNELAKINKATGKEQPAIYVHEWVDDNGNAHSPQQLKDMLGAMRRYLKEPKDYTSLDKQLFTSVDAMFGIPKSPNSFASGKLAYITRDSHTKRSEKRIKTIRNSSTLLTNEFSCVDIHRIGSSHWNLQ